MRRKLGALGIAAALAVLMASTVPGAAYGGDFNGRYKERWQMKVATNDARSWHDLRRLSLNDRLSELARRHSLKMASEGNLFHTGNPASYYLKGISWSRWGENVGVTSGTVRDIHKAFMASPSHRSNVLGHGFDHVAIGAVRVDGTLWVTVFFYG